MYPNTCISCHTISRILGDICTPISVILSCSYGTQTLFFAVHDPSKKRLLTGALQQNMVRVCHKLSIVSQSSGKKYN